MSPILIAILIGLYIIGYRSYRTWKLVRNRKGIPWSLPLAFYLEQAFGVIAISVFLMALDPVPSTYAILAVIGLAFDTLLTAVYYSAKSTS